MENERDWPDAIVWVDRLIEVANGSNFKPLEKYNIVSGLNKIRLRLNGLEDLSEKAGISH